jgi:hypothetical protein
MPILGEIDPKILSAFVMLGIVSMIAAIAGGVEALNVKIPPLKDTRVRAGLGAFGLLLVAISCYGLSLRQWNDRFDALVNGANGRPPPPFSQQAIEDGLNWLAMWAGDDYFRNCQIADFISVHEITILPRPVLRRLDATNKRTVPNPGLECYRNKVQAARSESQPTHESAGALSAKKEAAPKTPASRILAAVTSKSDAGWIYLGELASHDRLGSDRNIVQDIVGTGITVTTSVSIKLHDPVAKTGFRTARVVGVVPAESRVVIDALPREMQYQWARIRISSVPETHKI